MVEEEEEEIRAEDDSDPPEALPPAKTTWIEIVVVYLIAALPSTFVALAVPYPKAPPFWYGVGSLSIKSLGVSAVVLYLMSRSGLSWKHYGLGRNRDLTGYLIFVAAMIGGLLLVTYVAVGLRSSFASDLLHRPYRPALPHGGIEWAFLVLALCLNSIAEETAMRGFLTARLFDVSKSIPLSCLAAGFIFGIYHIYQGWAAACASILLGILFSAMFLSARRLKALIVAHTVINLVVYVLYVVKMNGGT